MNSTKTQKHMGDWKNRRPGIAKSHKANSSNDFLSTDLNKNIPPSCEFLKKMAAVYFQDC